MDKRVVQSLLAFPERDIFLRGCRAFAGFKQTGVDYLRPERMFGRSTNNLIKNLGWAKKGILSFSNTPLNILSFTGTVLLAMSLLLLFGQALVRVLYPELVPPGVTTLLLLILFFGSINLFAVGLVGEYIAKIFEEVKQRPHFIRRSVIRDGEVRPAADELASHSAVRFSLGDLRGRMASLVWHPGLTEAGEKSRFVQLSDHRDCPVT